jgi:hypothetical protein
VTVVRVIGPSIHRTNFRMPAVAAAVSGSASRRPASPSGLRRKCHRNRRLLEFGGDQPHAGTGVCIQRNPGKMSSTGLTCGAHLSPSVCFMAVEVLLNRLVHVRARGGLR